MASSNYNGFKELEKMLEEYSQGADDVIKGLEEGAKEFVQDALRLPKPISSINKAGYTHLVKTFAYRRKDKEIEVGWGKYYGSMVEHGTRKMGGRPHLVPLWDKNKEKYYKTMLTKLGFNV